MKLKGLIRVVMLLFPFGMTAVYGQSPLMNYQGKVANSDGTPLDGTVSIQFSMYDHETEGTALWSEVHSAVIIQNGIMNVLLGSINPLPAHLFDGSDRWLGLQIGDDPEMSPRQQIVSVGYALRADRANNADYAVEADMLDGQHASSFASGDHNHDADYLNEIGPESMTGESNGPILTVSNGGPGHGLMGEATVTGYNAGVYGFAHCEDSRGVWGWAKGYRGAGVYGTSEGGGSSGVWGNSSGERGIGLRGYATGADGKAVYGYALDSAKIGVHGFATTTSGYGGLFESEQYRGLRADAADGEYAGYFEDDIYATGCTGCGTMYVGRNDDSRPFEVGDLVVVNGVVPPVVGSIPVILVVKADGENGRSVIGVVRSRYVFEEIEGTEGPETSEKFDFKSKTVVPGEFLSIVVQGMGRVKVDASYGSVMAGDLLTVSRRNGCAVKAWTQAKANSSVQSSFNPIIGKALEPLETGSGLIWAMITLP